MEDSSRRNNSAISEGSMPSSSYHILARWISSVESFLQGSWTHFAALRFAALRFGMANRSKGEAKRVELDHQKAAHMQERISTHVRGQDAEHDRS